MSKPAGEPECRLVCPDEAGIGQVPRSFATSASKRVRSGLSPNWCSAHSKRHSGVPEDSVRSRTARKRPRRTATPVF